MKYILSVVLLLSSILVFSQETTVYKCFKIRPVKWNLITEKWDQATGEVKVDYTMTFYKNKLFLNNKAKSVYTMDDTDEAEEQNWLIFQAVDEKNKGCKVMIHFPRDKDYCVINIMYKDYAFEHYVRPVKNLDNFLDN